MKPQRRYHKKTRHRTKLEKASIYGVLDIFDVPSAGPFKRNKPDRRTTMKTGGGFWRRNHACLEYVLKDLEWYWRRAIRRHHPDNGGRTEDATAVNLMWAKCKRLFKYRGVSLG